MAIDQNGIGVIVKETEVNINVINALNINTLCLIGNFESGPINTPVEFFNLNDFIRVMGNYFEGSECWLQAYVYFEYYKGRRLVCIRVAHYTDITSVNTLTAVKASVNLDDKEAISGACNEVGNLTGVEVTVNVDGTGGDVLPTSVTGTDYIEFTGGAQIQWTGKTYTALTDNTELTGVTWLTALAVADDEAFIYVEETLRGAICDAKYFGAYGNDISVKVLETYTVDTTLSADLVTGATSARLTSNVNVVVGDVLNIADTVYPQITEIRDDSVIFSEAVTLASTITSGETVTNLRNTIEVYYKGVLAEDPYENVSVWSENQQFFIEKVVNISDYIKITMDLVNQSEILYMQQLKATALPVALTSGSNGGAVVDVDYIGSTISKTGLYALDIYKNPVMITQPDATVVAVQRAMAAYARNAVIHVAVGSLPHGLSVSGVENYSNQQLALNNQDGSYFFWFWPNIKIQHPKTLQTIQIHPCGSIVGITAKISYSTNQGPWINPAGTDNPLIGVIGLETVLVNGQEQIPTDDDAVISRLQRAKINPIIYDAEYGYLPLDH